jgi:hypothetical protein
LEKVTIPVINLYGVNMENRDPREIAEQYSFFEIQAQDVISHTPVEGILQNIQRGVVFMPQIVHELWRSGRKKDLYDLFRIHNESISEAISFKSREIESVVFPMLEVGVPKESVRVFVEETYQISVNSDMGWDIDRPLEREYREISEDILIDLGLGEV